MGQKSPRGTCSGKPAQSVENFPQAVMVLGCGFVHQCEVGGYEVLLFFTDITGVELSTHVGHLTNQLAKFITYSMPKMFRGILEDIVCCPIELGA